ncbi:IBR finger domain-containing protein [Fusarium mundagurra]|uniref:IBR finger domain-containing protein n=1 Tax=Fusarium mundagurra TaxID=1567541 RepID=A0A8H6D588_9HYPO|nr:IBR finger domain-containing protein [Fusarium mundagurra]
MDARQDYDEDNSSEEALPLISVRPSYEESTQRDRQYKQTPEQHLLEEPDTQDDSSHDEADLDNEMDVDDEGIEYTRDILDDFLHDRESDFKPVEDSEEPGDQGHEIEHGRAYDMDLQDMLDDVSDGFSDFETGEDTEEQQPNGESESQEDTPDDEMAVDESSEDMPNPLSDSPSDDEHSEVTSQQGRRSTEESESQDDTLDDEMNVDDQVEEFSEDLLDPFLHDPSDDQQGEETEQQSHQLAAPEDPATQEPAQTKTQDCGACCREELPVTIFQRLPCGHDYCRPCVINIFEISLSFASYFPARCCGLEIPLEAIEAHITQSDVQRYREKLVEHRTTDRTYCSNRQCLEFIPPNNTDDDGEPFYGDEAECPACNEITCTTCKGKGHTGACEK